MLHPVGPLPAAVYWRRRLLALGCALGLLGGGGWVAVAAATGGPDPTTEAAGSTSPAPAPTPALEEVLPASVAVQLPTAPTSTPPPVAETPAPVAETPAPAPAAAAQPTAGGPCSDDMIGLAVRPVSPSAPVGSKPTFELVVTNTSSVPCARTLDKGLQEIVLLDASGNRVWGSNDCYPEASADVRTLQPGESLAFPVLWSGLGSSANCAGERRAPAAGSYALRGRLDTKTSPDTAFTLT